MKTLLELVPVHLRHRVYLIWADGGGTNGGWKAVEIWAFNNGIKDL